MSAVQDYIQRVDALQHAKQQLARDRAGLEIDGNARTRTKERLARRQAIADEEANIEAQLPQLQATAIAMVRGEAPATANTGAHSAGLRSSSADLSWRGNDDRLLGPGAARGSGSEDSESSSLADSGDSEGESPRGGEPRKRRGQAGAQAETSSSSSSSSDDSGGSDSRVGRSQATGDTEGTRSRRRMARHRRAWTAAPVYKSRPDLVMPPGLRCQWDGTAVRRPPPGQTACASGLPNRMCRSPVSYERTSSTWLTT